MRNVESSPGSPHVSGVAAMSGSRPQISRMVEVNWSTLSTSHCRTVRLTWWLAMSSSTPAPSSNTPPVNLASRDSEKFAGTEM